MTLALAGYAIMQGHAILGFICITLASCAALVATNALSIFTIETVPDIVYVVDYTVYYVYASICAKSAEPLWRLLGSAGFFWFFAFFNMLNLIFIVIFVKETWGLSDVEKKALYSKSSANQDKPEQREFINPRNQSFIKSIAASTDFSRSTDRFGDSILS